MKAIKKINNNVAICIDNNNNELVAFGKGIGFPAMPYNIEDMSTIQMTFYRMDNRFYSLIQEIPSDILEVSGMITQRAEHILNCRLNPNLVASLADHINFVIIRMKKFKKLKMPFSYDIEHLYPKETDLGRYARKLVQRKLKITLPENEITSIAMHFVNAREEDASGDGIEDDRIIEDVAEQIDAFFDLKIDRDSFNFHRFAMHLRYFLRRLHNKEQFFDEAGSVLDVIKEKHTEAYECAVLICDYIDQVMNTKSNEDEKLYMMIHIYRIIYQEKHR
jgi:beta-glucoside operon transcriptional antiterminator